MPRKKKDKMHVAKIRISLADNIKIRYRLIKKKKIEMIGTCMKNMDNISTNWLYFDADYQTIVVSLLI